MLAIETGCCLNVRDHFSDMQKFTAYDGHIPQMSIIKFTFE